MSSEEYEALLDEVLNKWNRKLAYWAERYRREYWDPGIDDQGEAVIVEPLALPVPKEEGKE